MRQLGRRRGIVVLDPRNQDKPLAVPQWRQ